MSFIGRRRGIRVQYTLRTLLAIAAIVACFVGHSAQSARDQRLALDVVREKHGRVAYDWEPDVDGVTSDFLPVDLGQHGASIPGPAWLRRLIGDDFFQDVVVIRLHTACDADLKLFSRMKYLRILILDRSHVTDDGMRYVRQMRDLQELRLGLTTITDAGVAELRMLARLRELRLEGTRVTDAGVRAIALLPLECLVLDGTQITDEAVDVLARISSLKYLAVRRTRLTARSIETLRALLPDCEIDPGLHSAEKDVL